MNTNTSANDPSIIEDVLRAWARLAGREQYLSKAFGGGKDL